MVYLLFTYINYFLNTEMLLEIEIWTFLPFIGFIIGPILLLFTSNMLTMVAAAGDESPDWCRALSSRFLVFRV